MSMLGRKTGKTTKDAGPGPDPDTPLYPGGPTPAQLTEEGSVWRLRDPQWVPDYLSAVADADLLYAIRRRFDDPDPRSNGRAGVLRAARRAAGLPTEKGQQLWPAGIDPFAFSIHVGVGWRAMETSIARQQRAVSDYWAATNFVCSIPGCGSDQAREVHLVGGLRDHPRRLCPGHEAVANSLIVEHLRAQQLPDGTSSADAVRGWMEDGMPHLDYGPAPAQPVDPSTIQGAVRLAAVAQRG